MPKFHEETKCHFMKKKCPVRITKDEFNTLIKEQEKHLETFHISAIPVADSNCCTNCLLSNILKELRRKEK